MRLLALLSLVVPCSLGGGVAVLLTGQLRLGRDGVRAVRARCANASVFVSSYADYGPIASELAPTRRVLLAGAEDVARAREASGCCTFDDRRGSCWQWFALDRALRRWGPELAAFGTVVRTRSDLATPATFSYAALAASPGVVRCLTDNFFYVAGADLDRLFGDFFRLAQTRYCGATGPSDWKRYDAEFRRLVVPGASAFESCKRAPRPNHVVHNVPWMNMNRPGAAASFYSEYAFSYHVVAKGARCTPIGVPGRFCLERSATGGRAQCRDST